MCGLDRLVKRIFSFLPSGLLVLTKRFFEVVLIFGEDGIGFLLGVRGNHAFVRPLGQGAVLAANGFPTPNEADQLFDSNDPPHPGSQPGHYRA